MLYRIVSEARWFFQCTCHFTDVDECAQGLCGENMKCDNFPGSYSCSCRKGYREEMYWCNGMLRTHKNHFLLHSYVYHFGLYVARMATFQYSESDIPMISFSDVDECRFNVCEGSQTCINAPGSYKCSCSTTGYNKPGNCEGN